MKYRPNYPGTFASREDARTFLRSYVPWYNTSHKHSGIELFSPQDVFDGTWKTRHQVRDQALQRYFARHPERFRGRPKTPEVGGRLRNQSQAGSTCLGSGESTQLDSERPCIIKNEMARF
jgi:hypothetical protein